MEIDISELYRKSEARKKNRHLHINCGQMTLPYSVNQKQLINVLCWKVRVCNIKLSNELTEWNEDEGEKHMTDMKQKTTTR